MEYSKEDLMEAKKQILGVGENMGTEESKKIWEENAQFWDNAMGDESNEFHREVVRPKVTELLSPNPADYILDIACGNGNYSSYLAQRGAFLANDPDAFFKVCSYSESRLTGNHSPYPFEAFPEGNRAHLSGESILFCRIITEGLFGLRVTGRKKLRVSLKKRNISLSGLKLFGETFSISENGNGIVITTETEMYQTDQLEAVFDFEKRNFI